MASAEEPGRLQIIGADADRQTRRVLIDTHTSAISQGTKTPTGETWQALQSVPFTSLVMKQIIVEFEPDAAAIIESEESALTLPVDIMDSTGRRKIGSKTLTFDTMTGFTSAGTVDKTLIAGEPTRVASQTAPEGQRFRLAAGQKFHAYLGDNG